MKPSISIDLPGWCTLRRGATEDKSTELLLDLLEDEDVAGSSGTRDFSSKAKGSSNGSDDSDDEEAIARLFAVGGLKRMRNSDSCQQTGGGSAMRSNASSARSRRTSAGFHFQAETYVDWSCVRCTFINAYSEEACGGCGGANKKRDRLLRERREEAEKISRLQNARESRERSLKEEAFKDVLEDSDSDSDNDNHKPEETSAEQAGRPGDHRAPASVAAVAAMSESSGATPSGQDADQAGRVQQQSDRCGCVINMLPPDLLLQCAEYLGDTRSLCRVREVCLGWMVALDGREAGKRLWRPLFYRLRASGSIHKATDATGQQNGQLKVYDLGNAATRTHRNGTPGASALRNGYVAGMSTPSPSQQRLSSEGPSSATAAGKRSLWSSERSVSGSSAVAMSSEVSFSCVVCGLIQREAYSGKDCEMCASALALVWGREPPSPATPRLAYTLVNLSGGAAGGGSASASGSCSSPIQQQRQRCSVSGPPLGHRKEGRENVGGIPVDATRDGSVSEAERSGVAPDREEEVDEGGKERSVDWHFLVKRLAEEKRIAGGWGSLHHGWLWLQRELQNMLRRRRGDEQLGPCTVPGPASPEVEPPILFGDSRGAGVRGREGRGHVGARQQQQQQQANTPTGEGRAGGDGEPDPRVTKLVRKLSSKKWVLLYDSLKATFTLQAEGIAREVVFEAMAAADAAAARDASEEVHGVGGGRSARERRWTATAELDGLRGCVAAWEAYKDWCEEVDMACELLNEQISAERYRTAGAGCGRGDNTPYIRETALLSFRHSFALNVQICTILRKAISKGMPSTETGFFSRRGLRQKVGRNEPGSGPEQQNPQLDAAAASGDADELFTDLELMEDSRAIEFSVRSFSIERRVLATGGGGGGGRAGSRWASSGGTCGGGGGASAGGRALNVASSRSSRGSRPGNYYDWFLSKLEGKEAGIIRGDIDARGKSIVRLTASGETGAMGVGGAAGEGGVGLQTATREELLEMVGDMIEELDVADDALSKDRQTQGAMRRLLLLPIKRWQAAAAAAEPNNNDEEDPRNLLLAGLSPAPGKEGFHRLRGGAAGRRWGPPTMSSVGKDAGKSWEHLSTLFG